MWKFVTCIIRFPLHSSIFILFLYLYRNIHNLYAYIFLLYHSTESKYQYIMYSIIHIYYSYVRTYITHVCRMYGKFGSEGWHSPWRCCLTTQFADLHTQRRIFICLLDILFLLSKGEDDDSSSSIKNDNLIELWSLIFGVQRNHSINWMNSVNGRLLCSMCALCIYSAYISNEILWSKIRLIYQLCRIEHSIRTLFWALFLFEPSKFKFKFDFTI